MPKGGNSIAPPVRVTLPLPSMAKPWTVIPPLVLLLAKLSPTGKARVACSTAKPPSSSARGFCTANLNPATLMSKPVSFSSNWRTWPTGVGLVPGHCTTNPTGLRQVALGLAARSAAAWAAARAPVGSFDSTPWPWRTIRSAATPAPLLPGNLMPRLPRRVKIT